MPYAIREDRQAAAGLSAVGSPQPPGGLADLRLGQTDVEQRGHRTALRRRPDPRPEPGDRVVGVRPGGDRRDAVLGATRSVSRPARPCRSSSGARCSPGSPSRSISCVRRTHLPHAEVAGRTPRRRLSSASGRDSESRRRGHHAVGAERPDRGREQERRVRAAAERHHDAAELVQPARQRVQSLLQHVLREPGRGLGEVPEDDVRPGRGQLVGRARPGGHRDRDRTGCSGTRDVMGMVADVDRSRRGRRGPAPSGVPTGRRRPRRCPGRAGRRDCRSVGLHLAVTRTVRPPRARTAASDGGHAGHRRIAPTHGRVQAAVHARRSRRPGPARTQFDASPRPAAARAGPAASSASTYTPVSRLNACQQASTPGRESMSVMSRSKPTTSSRATPGGDATPTQPSVRRAARTD